MFIYKILMLHLLIENNLCKEIGMVALSQFSLFIKTTKLIHIFYDRKHYFSTITSPDFPINILESFSK